LEPPKDAPDSWCFFEQWQTKADYDAHSETENLKLFLNLAGDLMDGGPTIIKTSMKHYERIAHSGRKYGILVEGKVKGGKMDEFKHAADAHFTRQLDGREPNATCATIIEAAADEPDKIRFFEQWDSKRDYAAHSKPNDNLKVFMEAAGSLWEDVIVKEFPMHHYARSKPGVSAPPAGATEMRVTMKKSPGFYVKSAASFFKGVEAKADEDGKTVVAAKPSVEFLRISGLGDAVGVAVNTASRVEADGLGEILKMQTAYPPMPGSGRGCAQIVIDMKRK
jgi:quinol monooxygenase YgiN